jgi:ATPase subunit of ABC transporter with duplicated ATPase domains
VAQEAKSEMTVIENAKERLRIISEQVEGGDFSDAALEEMGDAQEEFEQAGGYEQEQIVDTVLKGLGFEPEDSDRLCTDFSGGWQMRIALARLLLSRPSLLLLDEPSNHLDSSARDWLGKYVAAYDGSVVLVSHDIGLLDASVNSIAEISGNTLLEYRGCSYTKYLEEKEFRAQSAWAEYERNLEEAARLQAFVDKFGASATKAASAQSRVKMLEKMKREGKLDPPPVAVMSKGRAPELVLPPPPKPLGQDLLKIEGASVGHDPNEEPLLTNVDLTIQRGMKLLLRGPNGAGKSTLLKALRGNLPHMLMEGTRTENERLRLGVFTQDLAQELDPKKRAVDLVTEYARGGDDGDVNISDEDARNVMGRLNLGGDKPLRKIGALSGGEKARVALSMFALKASNLLMLDEPSNHLDVGCIDALARALSQWGGKDGAIVVISHDRSFCDEVGFTHVGTVMNGKLVLEQRPLRESDWEQYDIRANGN